MIEAYFKSGIRFLWNKPNDSMGATNGSIVASQGVANRMTYDGLDGHRAIIDPRLLLIQASNVLGIRKGAIIPHAWLDYAPGRTARLAIGGNDILSGYMSGCLIVRGTYNHTPSLFHVGTIVNNIAVNKSVKSTFAKELPADATGFSPSAAWQRGEMSAAQTKLEGAAGTAQIFALVTRAGAFYSLMMIPVSEGGKWANPAGQKYWCVGGIKPVVPLTRTRLLAALLDWKA